MWGGSRSLCRAQNNLEWLFLGQDEVMDLQRAKGRVLEPIPGLYGFGLQNIPVHITPGPPSILLPCRSNQDLCKSHCSFPSAFCLISTSWIQKETGGVGKKLINVIYQEKLLQSLLSICLFAKPWIFLGCSHTTNLLGLKNCSNIQRGKCETFQPSK